MAPPGRHERRALRKAAGVRARAGRLRKDEHVTDFTDPAVARKWKRRSLTAISISAAAGTTWYALEPGVASYQVGYTLALPALITASVWIGKRLPRWLDWVIAIALGAGGATAYVLVGGSRWWLWAQFALLPFVLLVVISSVKPPKPGQSPPEPWYGGMRDGPWGPP
jgi:peptidoglycan/LPS O-acetylase OafA/YrhL